MGTVLNVWLRGLNIGWRRVPRIHIAFVAAAAALLAGAVAVFSMTGPADRPPSAPENFLARGIRRVLLPIRARSVSDPAQPTTSGLIEGRRIFNQSCSMCHGAYGQADAPLSKAFYPPVPALTGSESNIWSDRELYVTIRDGVRLTAMPAWRSSLKDEEIWNVVAYIRKLSAANAPRNSPDFAAQSALDIIDDEGCRDCHRIGGEGAKIGPDLSQEWARQRSDAWLRGHFRDPKKYTPGTVMPAFTDLSDDQLNKLVNFLQQPQ